MTGARSRLGQMIEPFDGLVEEADRRARVSSRSGASKHCRKVFELVQFSQFVPLFDRDSDAVEALA